MHELGLILLRLVAYWVTVLRIIGLFSRGDPPALPIFV